MNDLIIAILALAFCGSTAAFLVMWANRDEWKKKAEVAQEDYQFLLEIYASVEDSLTRECNLNLHLLERNHNLQDRLSALLCPHNDHVWLEGRCKKCGRTKE